MENIIITRASESDIYKLQEIGRQTFEETFSASNTEGNMKEYLETGFSIDKLSTELQDKYSEFYLAQNWGRSNWLPQSEFWSFSN